MLPPKDRLCHRTGFTQSCRELVAGEKCGRWRQVIGAHPQTNEALSRFDCIDDHIFLLLLSLGKEQGQTTASVNKVHTAQDNHRRQDVGIVVGLIETLGAVGDRIERAAQAIEGASEGRATIADTRRPALEHHG